MTATLIALLVARGDLAWETPLGELLPDLATEMDLDYGDVTLVELLTHRAGVPDDPRNALLAPMRLDAVTPRVAQRAVIVRDVLTHPPAVPPRSAFRYSNFGYVIAGHAAEVATERSWESLMQALLFDPLGMSSGGFGAPGSPGVCDEPRGHFESGELREPGPLADNPLALGPAGTVHASLADWAKFVQVHLRGARGDVEIGGLTLTRAAFARLHTPHGATPEPYAFGWDLRKMPWADREALYHNGTNTLWFCEAWLDLERGVAVLVTTNRSSQAGKSAVQRVAQLLMERS